MIERALADQLLGERGLAEVAHLALLTIVVLFVRSLVPASILLPWSGGIMLLIAARAVLWRRARRAAWPPRTVFGMVRGIMAALGLAWGLGGALAAPYLGAEVLHDLILGLAVLLAGGLATLAADRWAFAVYALALFVPLLSGIAIIGMLDAPEAVVVIVYVGFMMRLHTRAFRMLSYRVEVENELRHRDRHYAAAEALTHVGSWEMDWATQAVTWSAEAYRLYDVPAGSPVGHDLFVSRVHPDDRARVVQVVGEGMTQLKDVEFEFRVIRPDGSIRYLLGRNMITRDASGAPLRLSGISLDLTRQKEAEAALKAALLEVKTVRGYLRVCANCRRVLGKDGAWEQLEAYVRRHSEAEFSHGICPDCAEAWARSADAL